MIKYYFNINDVRIHAKNDDILIIQGWFRKNNPEHNKIKIYLDDKELDFELHEYSDDNIKKKYITLDNSVDTEYHFYVKLPEDYKEYEKLYIFTVNQDKKKLMLHITTEHLEDMRKGLIFCVDNIQSIKETKKCIVTGWVVSDDSVEFLITNPRGEKQKIKVSQDARMDVVANFKETSLETKCGFQIEFDYSASSKFILKLKTQKKESSYLFTVKQGFHKNRKNRLWLMKQGFIYLRCYGLKKTIRAILKKLKHENHKGLDYGTWRMNHIASAKELEEQRNKKNSYEPKFSIVVPLYKTPKNYLDEFVNSVIEQTYSHWELCLSDGSGINSPLKKILESYEQKDGRIKIIQHNKQLQISDNTNKAIEAASGDFIVFADHDDLLSPDALYECVKILNNDKNIDIIYSDEDKISMDGKEFFQPHFKSDFNIDLLCSMNYISHLFVVKKDIINKVGLLNPEFDGAQDYDLILRCIEITKNIHHISKVLYHWRAHKDSTAENPESKLYAFEAGKRAIEAHYKRLNIPATVEHGTYHGLYRTHYHWDEQPLISILIPNKDHISDLKSCISSIDKKSTYKNYEYIIIENNSEDSATFEYYEELKKKNPKVNIVYYEGDFNYSKINNFGVQYAKGDYLLLLNNDTEIINKDCLEELIGFCMRTDVGIVGARLYYGDNTIQHAGVVVGFGGIAGHTFIGASKYDNGYFSRIICAQNYSAVTAACMMVKKDVFDEVGGLSEELKIAFNDIDFCMKVRRIGKLVVYNPYAELYHYESKSRGLEDTPEKVKRFNGEIDIFTEKWPEILRDGDPYYNINLTLNKSDFSLNEI